MEYTEIAKKVSQSQMKLNCDTSLSVESNWLSMSVLTMQYLTYLCFSYLRFLVSVLYFTYTLNECAARSP
jgi:hypothetical protein